MGGSSSKIIINNNEVDKQMNYSIYKIGIDNEDEDKGFGFLSLSPSTKTKILITNSKCIKEEIIKEQKGIKLTRLNSHYYNIIDTKIERAYYINEKYNISIIEIKDEDHLELFKNITYLEYDVNMNNKNLKAEYKDKNIYIPYKEKDKKEYPVGKIKSIDERIIKHNCNNIDENNSYFPILLVNNLKVIGFNLDKEKGIFLKYFLDEFEKKVKELKQREEDSKQSEEDLKQSRGEEKDIKSLNSTPSDPRINESIKSKDLDEEIERRMAENKKNQNKGTPNITNVKVNNSKNDVKNNILLLIDVKPGDINEEIYFFGKYEDKDKKGGFLKEIENFKDKVILKIERPNKQKDEDLAFDTKFKPNLEGMYSIEVEFKGRINDCSYMFYDCSNLYSIDLSNFDFTDVVNMSDMFNYCINLKEVKFNQKIINTVDNMSYMFNHCKKLEKIDLNNFRTEKVTSMAGMFQHCESLKEINISNFDTSNVIQLSCMFNDCYNLENIILPKKISTDKMMFMPWMFYGCSKLKNLDLSSLKCENQFVMNNMFDECNNIVEIKIKKDNIYLFNDNRKMKNKFTIV